MKANELRIGNWVINNRYFKEWGQHQFQVVNEICVDGKIGTNKAEWDVGHLTPIPLTPEILEKSGFKKTGIGYYGGLNYLLDQFSFDFSGSHLDLCECVEGNYVNKKNIKYLHQLQNLYFALTGEELEINL